MQIKSVLTCPYCGHKVELTMPMKTCQFFYTCTNCNETIRPKDGDCCVFCSYGSNPCPSIQKKLEAEQ